MPSAEEIVSLWQDRKKRMEPRFGIMADFDAAYAGETYLPVPELARNEKPMVANLLATGLDQTAMRIASTLPDPEFPPMRTTVQSAEDRARTRHDVTLSWWAMNDMVLKLKERARHLLGYSTTPVFVGYDPAYPYPIWKVLDPFTTFTPPPAPTREFTPLDVICTYDQPLKWLKRLYPGHMDMVYKGHDPSPDDVYTCLQYYGHDETVLIIMGRSMDPSSPSAWASPAGSGKPWIETDRQPNLAGICPVVVPNRIVLNRNKPMGVFDGLIGVFEWQAKLMALGSIAAERDIFPDIWAMSRPNENVNIETEADGLKGVVGKVSGGVIETTHKTPGGQTLQMISILERALRLEGGVPAEFTGESPSSTRTARRGAQVLSEAVDFAIQEAQQIFEVSLREENVRAIATDKAYYGHAPRAFYFDWKGRKGSGVYDPAEIWETDRHSVNYSAPGSDMNSLTVAVGQNIGIGLMSKERGMELTPTIKDPALEKTRVTMEALEQAFLAGVQTMVSQPGGFPLPDFARLMQLVKTEQMEVWEAALKVQEEAQQRQADTPESPAVPSTDPAAQPGIAMPEQGAEAATIAEPPAGLNNVSDLMAAMRGAGRGAA
jgi:hypothetical protein